MEKDFQRWTAKRKVELLLQLIKGETTLVDACREHDLKQSEVEGWMEVGRRRAPPGCRVTGNALRATPLDPPMPAGAHPVEVIAPRLGAVTVEVDADRSAPGTLGTPTGLVGERREVRFLDGRVSP
jgi:transposase-like protein